MKRTLSFLLLAVFLTLAVPFSAAASSPRLDDGADLLSYEEERNLLYQLDTLSAERGVDYVVVTVPSMGGKTEMQYADDYYDTHGYREDGILLLIDMETRAYYESTAGSLQDYFEYYYEYLEDDFVSYLSYGDYYGAFTRFARSADDRVDECRREEAYNRMPTGEKIKYRLRSIPTSVILIPLIIGLIAAAIMTSKEKAKLTSVRMQNDAANYVRKNSMDLTSSRDTFLYSHVTRVRIETESSSGGRSGGGSSIHFSSGGVSHGGHGGHF
ncbi:MAG: TPM domain-containing protein [Lachnospiraceae bacterium]|nr:TPM domain-containing protein [Lachnospiraceae bacterium]